MLLLQQNMDFYTESIYLFIHVEILWINHSPAVTLITESRETEIDALWIRTWLVVAALGNKKK